MHGRGILEKLQRYQLQHKTVWSLALMLMFVLLFDGIVGYTLPLLLTEKGLSKTEMGLVFSFSSMAGGVFDLVLSRLLKRVDFRRMFLFLFILCLLYPILLWSSKSMAVYLLAMAVWGLYWDFMSFGSYDFVGRHTSKNAHATSFGIIDAFKSAGLLLAPILAGLLVIDRVTSTPYILAVIFLGIGFIFYLVLITNAKKGKYEIFFPVSRRRSILSELGTWRSLGKALLPVLVFTIYLNIHDAFFWTIGPLISEELVSIQPFGGLFITAYYLPSLVVGWFLGRFTNKYGKKRTAFVSMAAGCLVLVPFTLISNAFLLLSVVFVASMLSAISWPAIKGAYADYVSEAPKVESDIEGIGDLSTNVGYVIGPALAGFLADTFGNTWVFSVLGITGFVLSIILFKLSPKHIRVSDIS